MIRIVYISIAVAMLLAGCSSYVSDPVQNFAYLYSNSASELRLDVRVHHDEIDHSLIYFQMHTQDLLYKSAGAGQPFKTAVKLHYRTFASVTSKNMLDSASTYVRDASSDPTEDKILIGKMPMSRDPSREMILVVTARDLNRDLESTVLIKIPSASGIGAQDILPLDAETRHPLFDDHVKGNMDLILYSPIAANTSLDVEYFDHERGLPSPVFSLRSDHDPVPEPTSIFQVEVDEEGLFPFTTAGTGFYRISNGDQSSSYTLFVMTDAYPTVDQVQDMIPPIRYITSTEEFNTLLDSDTPRREIEKLWVDFCGSKDRARGSIKAYYTRVESANRFFTAEVEGWRTDRGLVHIIFGTPNVIQKGDRSETWIYGEENSLMSLRFLFLKKDNPFTDNDMQLERDPSLKGAWYRNVESWRNGRVYLN